MNKMPQCEIETDSDLMTIEDIALHVGLNPEYVSKKIHKLGIRPRGKIPCKTRSRTIYSLSEFDEDAHISNAEMMSRAIALCESLAGEMSGNDRRTLIYAGNALRHYRFVREELQA